MAACCTASDADCFCGELATVDRPCSARLSAKAKALAIVCPTCGAAPGASCSSPGVTHGKRRRAAAAPPTSAPDRVDRALAAMTGASPEDFAALAMAALDQAGVTAEDQATVSKLLAEYDLESDAMYHERTGEPRGAGADWAGREAGDFCE